MSSAVRKRSSYLPGERIHDEVYEKGESIASGENLGCGKDAETKGKGKMVSEARHGNSVWESAQRDVEIEGEEILEALRRSQAEEKSTEFALMSKERRDAVHAQNERRRWNTLQAIRCPCSTVAQLWGELEREPEGSMARPARVSCIRRNASREQGRRRVERVRFEDDDKVGEPAEEESEAEMRRRELQTAIDESLADQRGGSRRDAELREAIRLSRIDSSAERARAKALELEMDVASDMAKAASRPKVRSTEPVRRRTEGKNRNKRPATRASA
ncbi:MAG: hypothetical protein M1830_000112 [Pleopsidium flavum]|nr:MAG: hypothetical protein M1830_000112 [Pleopsidium flavum]